MMRPTELFLMLWIWWDQLNFFWCCGYDETNWTFSDVVDMMRPTELFLMLWIWWDQLNFFWCCGYDETNWTNWSSWCMDCFFIINCYGNWMIPKQDIFNVVISNQPYFESWSYRFLYFKLLGLLLNVLDPPHKSQALIYMSSVYAKRL